MRERAYLLITAIIFGLVALLHLVRLVNHWSVQLGTFAVPFWGSWLGLVIGVVLSLWAVRLMTHQLSSSH
ncbi:MAG: hypothetical protein KME17_14620 [Cyanosarcina radialis HA8281-LM2]|jgi:ABC-type proline/glycine betaine transport system permease subunit|nr:hypothetical protein [Cyanosarcina radialis HA8281-LM2]